MNKYEFYSTILQEDFPVKYREVIADNDSEQRKEIRELREALARVEAELKTINKLKDRYLARWRYSQSACEKALMLLSFIYDHAEQHRPGSLPNEQVVRVFLTRHALAEQQEACDYCGPGKHTGLPGAACENCMNTGLKYPEQEAHSDGE